MPKKKTTKLLEPEDKPTVEPAIVISDGSIGVEYTPPPVTESEEVQQYDCGNCATIIPLRCERCPQCELPIDWSSLDN